MKEPGGRWQWLEHGEGAPGDFCCYDDADYYCYGDGDNEPRRVEQALECMIGFGILSPQEAEGALAECRRRRKLIGIWRGRAA